MKKGKSLVNLSEQAFNNFTKLKESHLFMSEQWLSLYDRKKFRFYGIKEEDNKFSAAWPLYCDHFFCLNVITHPPLTPYLGIAATQASREIIKMLVKSIKNLKPDYLQLPFHPIMQDIDFMPFRLHGIQIEMRYTFLLDLTKSENELWKDLDEARRRNIRRARKDNLEIHPSSLKDIPTMLSLIQKTFHCQGLNPPWLSLAEQVMKISLKNKWGQGWLVFDKGDPIATIFIVWDTQIAYYLVGGYDRTLRHYGAGPLAMWEAILFAKNRELQWFDFEGSEIPSIERYFRKFGARQTSFYVARYMSPRCQFLDAIRRWYNEKRNLWKTLLNH